MVFLLGQLTQTVNRKNRLAGASVAAVLAWVLGFFHLYTAGFGLLQAMYQRGIHLTLALVLIFLYYPLKRRFKGQWLVNLVPVLLAAFVGLYMLIFASPARLAARSLTGMTTLDLVIGALLILVLLEATRRITGNAMVVVALLFLAYAYFGRNLPSLLAHRGYDIQQIIEQTVFTHEGIYGTPLAVSASFIVLFVLFGAFLEESGGGQFFVDLAYALAGRTRSGPAMTAVVSSALMGTISGSAASNVVTTGTFTIPLMKKVGYPADVAGAIEAVASTGGQVLPPVMGAAAFIMAEMLGISYGQVALAAALPAVLYFVSVGVMVHLGAVKRGLQPLPRQELPVLREVLKNGWYYFIPLILIIYTLVILMYTPTKSALWAIGATVAVSFLSKDGRMTPQKILRAVEKGVKGSLVVAAACATAGIVIGIVTITGLGLRFSNLIVTASGGSLIMALILTAVTCLILGMGLPTSAAYIITVTLGAPALVNLGLQPIAAHMFVLYFASISAITPPVAIAAYAAAGVANSPPMSTGFHATRIGIAAFVVPFMFAYGPAMLLVGSPLQVVQVVFTSLLGVWMLASGVQGWFLFQAGWPERILLLAGALMLIETGSFTDLVGIALAIAVVAWQLLRRKETGGMARKGSAVDAVE
ncbi:hypothetical protein SY88_15670 [Clostridiales bacterium PH28_bin88]|nr:hypothetical protein SY88_15670 [Clostridiales bacterium PH28_bin88]